MNTKLPQINLVFNRRKTASTTTKASVELRITYNYKQKWISTGIRLYSFQWKNGKIINCPDILQISQNLDNLLTNVRQIILDMQKEGEIDISLISQKLTSLNASSLTFIDFCKQRAEIRKYNKKKDTQERYTRFLRLFTSWGKMIHFQDITEQNIILYDKYLLSTGMQTYSKWNNYHRFLNSFIKDAMEEGLLTRNPYMWINIPKDKASRGLDKCLTPEEFKKVQTSIMPTKALERVRDFFVFQTYTCLRYSDLKNFDAQYIKIIKGMPVYIRKSIKTDKPFTVPLSSPVMKILAKYHNRLPIISNPKYNTHLKVVAQAAGIDKPLSTHWARHTGATMLLNAGAEMKIVTKICGHSSTRITEQVYAKLLNETVVNAIQEIEGNLK